ncbi:MAG: hypothetical protein ACREJN_02510 [Nitrospiraceae bacterium]
MTQANIALVFLTGFVGIMLLIIGVIALDIIRGVHRTDDKRHGIVEQKQHDEYRAHHVR